VQNDDEFNKWDFYDKIYFAMKESETFVERYNSIKSIYPKYLPFSSSVPVFSEEFRKVIKRFYRFADGFTQQTNEVEDLIKKTTENTLIEFNRLLATKIQISGISIVCQIYINIEYFILCCGEYEDILTQRRYFSIT
jgi:exocyst complex component 6